MNEIDFFDDKIVLYITKITESIIRVYDVNRIFSMFKKSDKKEQESLSEKKAMGDYLTGTSIKFRDNQFGTVYPGGNMNLKQDKVRFHFDSVDCYNVVYDLDLKKNSVKILEDFEHSGAKFKKENYKIEIIYAPSHDGTDIPITLIYNKNLLPSNLKGFRKRAQVPVTPQKLLLRTYGCYGISTNLNFSITDWSLLENDWIIALAHIRGGKELGEDWHLQAKGSQKINSIQDILSCAEH